MVAAEGGGRGVELMAGLFELRWWLTLSGGVCGCEGTSACGAVTFEVTLPGDFGWFGPRWYFTQWEGAVTRKCNRYVGKCCNRCKPVTTLTPCGGVCCNV